LSSFNEFFAEWKDRVAVVTSADLTRDLYFSTERDELGFDILPDYIGQQGVEWSVAVAGEFELGAALASRLDCLDITKFRMIFDRHMVNLSKAQFDEDYLRSSDERALFLIFHKVAPVQIFSAMSRIKNVTFDLLHESCEDGLGERELSILSALSTLFFIELNHIMRVYVYFERYRDGNTSFFDVIKPGQNTPRDGYCLPTTNGQMSYPDKSKYGMMELF